MLTAKERFTRTLNGERTDRVPTFLSGCLQSATFDTMNEIQVFFPDAHKDPVKMAKLSLATYKYTGIECIGLPFDLTIEAELLGGTVLWKNEKDYIPTAKPATDPETAVRELKVPEDVSNLGRVKVVLKALEIINENAGVDDLPVASGISGPFTMAGSLIGAEKFFEWLFTQGDTILDVMRISTQTLIKYASLMQEKNPDVITIAEPMASGTLINRELFEKFVAPFITEIVKSCKPPVMLHICGKSASLINSIVGTGARLFSFDENVDVAVAKESSGGRLILVGNISPAKTLLLGTKEDVTREALMALDKGIDVLAPGCGIPARTPNENLLAMSRAAKRYPEHRS